MEQKRKYILELFNNAKNKKIKACSIPIGRLTEEGKKYLFDISGLNFRNFADFVLNTSDLRHIYKDHYGGNEKDKSNNIPLTDDDIKKIIDVIATPDTISFLGYDKNKDANKFEFLKENENGTYNLIEVYGEKGGKLTVKTFFNKKRRVSKILCKWVLCCICFPFLILFKYNHKLVEYYTPVADGYGPFLLDIPNCQKD
jgi:hypothetical protein